MPLDSTNFWIDGPTIDLEPAGIGTAQACGATAFGPAPKVVIFRPSRSVMQAGKANAKRWVIEFEPASKPFNEPLMGWTGSEDPTTHVRLVFATRDQAVRFAERQGWNYAVFEPHEPKRRVKDLLAVSAGALLLTASAAGETLVANWTNAADAAVFNKSSEISLLQAISLAEKAMPGRAVHAAFRTGQGKALFDVEILSDKALHAVTIDANANKATGSQVIGPLEAVGADQKDIETAAAGTIDIEDAVARADALGYWAVDAGIVDKEGKPAYRVDLYRDGKLETVTVDPASAKVTTPSR